MGTGLDNRCLERVGNPDKVRVLKHGSDMTQDRASGTGHSRYRQKMLSTA